MYRSQTFWKKLLLITGVLTLVAVGYFHFKAPKQEPIFVQPTPSVTTPTQVAKPETIWRRVMLASDKVKVSLTSAPSIEGSGPDRARRRIAHKETRDYRTSVQPYYYSYSPPTPTRKPIVGLCPNCGRVHELAAQPNPPTPARRDYTQTSTQPTRTYTPRDYGTPVAPVIPTTTRNYTPPASNVQPTRTREYVIVGEFPPPKPVTVPVTLSKPLSEIPLQVHSTPKIELKPIELHLVPVGRPAPKRVYIPPANVQPVYTPSPTILPGTSHMVGSYYHGR